MNPTRRWTSAALGLLLGAGLGTVATASPASATVTTLCSGYTACAKAGMGNSGYSTANGTMYWRMFSGHNCTNYAAYRMVRAGLPNVRPWTGGGNATNWGSAMSRLTTATPTVGAVAWWRAGVKPAGSVGHVGYVEKVVSPDEILVSQDSWHGDFSWTRITRTSSGWPSGFVHFADVRLLSVAAPTVTGTAKVGNTLTATAGSWSVPGASYAYQWYADGVAVPQATTGTLALTRDQVGRALTVKVTASLLGYAAATAGSAPTAAVAPGVLSSTAAPSVSGTPAVGQTLTATPGAWTPAPDGFAYTWRADGQPVAGAQGASFTPGPEQVGQAISVAVVASKSGYPDLAAASAPTAPVARGTLDLASRPTVAGTSRPGRALDLVLPTLPAGAATSVLWRRANVVVPGARAATYAITPADLGSRLVAQVLVTKPGYTPVLMRTFSSDVVRTPSAIRVSAVPGTGRLSLRGTVVARDVRAVDGVLQVRSRGRLLRSVPVTDGAVAATVTGLPRGTHTYRLRLLTSATVLGGFVDRRLTIR